MIAFQQMTEVSASPSILKPSMRAHGHSSPSLWVAAGFGACGDTDLSPPVDTSRYPPFRRLCGAPLGASATLEIRYCWPSLIIGSSISFDLRRQVDF
jgi:hypothetical protein